MPSSVGEYISLLPVRDMSFIIYPISSPPGPVDHAQRYVQTRWFQHMQQKHGLISQPIKVDELRPIPSILIFRNAIIFRSRITGVVNEGKHRHFPQSPSAPRDKTPGIDRDYLVRSNLPPNGSIKRPKELQDRTE